MDLLRSLINPSEILSLFKAKKMMAKLSVPIDADDKSKEFCYDVLKQVSRSFAAVIMQLDGEVRDAVCVFYLVLRALDTVEDDMSYPIEKKVPELLSFYKRTDEPNWCMSGVGKGAEAMLLEKYYFVSEMYRRLPRALREPIAEICMKMGAGMADFIQRKSPDIENKEQYNLYCHYVAGLVGHGLSKIFAGSGLEDPKVAENLDLANSMGLFLQKTNIIRDYLEDIMEVPPRMFWPKEIWGLYTDDFHSFRLPENRKKALECLNHMILDALNHVADSMAYLQQLKNRSVFTFCAIPQIMAIATLCTLYNNEGVFRGVVKIRKGQACQIMLDAGDMVAARNWFQHFIRGINWKLLASDPNADATREVLRNLYKENRIALLAEGAAVDNSTRGLISSYVPLGGQFLYMILDAVSFWGKTDPTLEGFD